MRSPFSRKDSNQTIAELENYYGSSYNSSGTRTGKAWAMALLSLIITLAVIAGLFFAGKWLYDTISDNDSSSETTTQEDTPQGEVTVDGTNPLTTDPRSDDDEVIAVLGQDDNDQSNADSTTDNDGATSSDESAVEEGGVVSDEAASITRDVAGDSNTSTNTTRNDSNDEDLPSTGAGDILFAIPAVTIVLGYYISRRHQQKSLISD